MTAKEFESYTRGIAYHVLKFRHGKIDGDELYEALLVQLGRDTFEEVEMTMDENKKRS